LKAGSSPAFCFFQKPPPGGYLFLDGSMTIDHFIQTIRGFEQLAIQFLLTVVSVSALARWTWGELQQWQSPKMKNSSSKKTR
jgi:hypothetical protein